MKKYICIIVAIFLALSLISCSQDRQVSKDNSQNNSSDGQQTSQDAESENPNTEGDQTGEESLEDPEPIDYNLIKPNEAGQIMILMYHEIGDTEAEWVRTPENFRKDLETLYNKGYRLISMKDYLNNNIYVEAGYTPVIITFDDGSRGQFNIIEEEGELKIDPDCAVAILEEFNKKHPDFGMASTFYVYYPVPFRQEELIQYKFEYLLERGMDIGNHSYTHENLGSLNAQEIQRVLALNVKLTQEYLPGYEVDSLALPYGARPKDERAAYIERGEHDGTAYHNKGVLLVGANPAPSPVHVKYNPKRLPRVRASQTNTEGVGMYDWLEYFDNNPGKRYISDGNADTVAIPEGMEEYINKEALGQKELIVYSLEQ
ncbi:MAG: polysaccharide deacetylase family protein [Mahellales bacterium]|jgi:peptidoglycan/xylan/chitin deacetylase (PgdA/CDA1 family)